MSPPYTKETNNTMRTPLNSTSPPNTKGTRRRTPLNSTSQSSLHQGNPQHHEDPNQLHESSKHQGNVQNNIEPAPSSQIWPNDLISILQKIMATPCQPPMKPIFEFDLSIEAASKNYILLKHTFGGDLQRALDAQPNSPLRHGSKFRQIETLKSIFENHTSWNRTRSVLTFGSSWPLAPLDEMEREKDVEEAIIFGNHKGTVKQQDLLIKLVKDDVTQGFALPLPLNKIASIPGVLLAPLNIQAQSTINERGENIPKDRLTHDQSWKWQSKTSVNSRVEKEKLMPCYFGRAIKRLINWAVAVRRNYPNKRILATKLDIKAVYRQCHLNTTTAIQTCTQLPTKGLALMMLRLTFGGAPCPAEWGSIAESICDLANEFLLRDEWEPLSLFSPAQHLVPEKTDNIPFGIGRELVVDIPVDPRGKIDIYIYDFVCLMVDIDGSDNAKRMESAPLLPVNVTSREVSELEPLSVAPVLNNDRLYIGSR
jgi:hypothetical protein